MYISSTPTSSRYSSDGAHHNMHAAARVSILLCAHHIGLRGHMATRGDVVARTGFGPRRRLSVSPREADFTSPISYTSKLMFHKTCLACRPSRTSQVAESGGILDARSAYLATAAVKDQEHWISSLYQIAVHALQDYLQSAERQVHAPIGPLPLQLRQDTSGCDASCMDHPLPYFSTPAVGRSHGRARHDPGTQLN